MLVQATDVGFDQHQARDLGGVSLGEGADVIAAEGIPDQDVGPADAGMVKRAVQLIGDAHAGARHGARIAEPRAGAVVAAGARPTGDLRLHDCPYGRPVLPA